MSIRSSWPEFTPFWAAVFRAFAIVEIISARGMPFSFSIYSRTERISLLMAYGGAGKLGKKKRAAGPTFRRESGGEPRRIRLASGIVKPAARRAPPRAKSA
jgi:hypothetical protein